MLSGVTIVTIATMLVSIATMLVSMAMNTNGFSSTSLCSLVPRPWQFGVWNSGFHAASNEYCEGLGLRL